MKRTSILLMASVLAFAAGCSGDEKQAAAASKDTLFVNGRIYTANSDRAFASAMLVSGEDIIAVYDDASHLDVDDGKLNVVDLEGRLVLPGLHDAHLHPIGAMPVETCSLENTPMTLAAIADFASECTARPGMAEGEWRVVVSWNFAAGNQPGDRFATIREALDAVSADKPVILRGSDGHHFAVNSAALARAVNANGEQVGFTAQSLATDFADLAPYIGVDESGEPNGRLTEDYALAAIGAGDFLEDGIERRRAQPELMMAVTLPRGITSFLDAAADPETLDIYDALIARNAFHARAHLALYFDPSEYGRDDGSTDTDAIIAKANAIREKYAAIDNIEADFLKLFADGVLEGDPLSDPPTLPNAAMIADYLQPVYAWNDEAQWVDVTGYVDLDGQTCAGVRAALALGESLDVAGFKAEKGFHPMQCVRSNGVLQHPEQMIRDYVKAGDAAGYTFHIHAIGDRAVTTALDALAAARRANGTDHQPIVTHLQVVAPDDIARFAAENVFASFTFAWAVVDPQYDTTVIPFIDDVTGPNGVYDPGGYYWRQAYPAEAIRKAGGVVIAGSDAPVDTIDPRPFINIEAAVTRAMDGRAALNPAEAISIFDAVDAYTINAATALKQDRIAGSLEPGKKADFIVLDRDIFELADTGRAADISETEVLETWFGGAKVYALNASKSDGAE